MATDPRKYRFSIDLKTEALDHLAFLKEVSQNSLLQNEHVLKQALFRYEKLWLPLAAKHPETILAAPLDIEWIWHCHLLSPISYQKDCQQIAGVIVNHRIFNAAENYNMLQKSHTIWRDLYPNHPFEVDLRNASSHSLQVDSPSHLSYDVIAASARQSVFFYQVSLPHFKDHHFLTKSEERYRKFLYLKQANPSLFIVPCYDIDLMWHTHQLHPLAYKKDMEAILGVTLNHDDSVTDRSEGSKLYNSNMETRELWQKTYNEKYALCGAMYRGDPPNGRLVSMTEQEYHGLNTKSANICFESVEIKNISGSRKLKLLICTSVNDRSQSSAVTLKKGPVWRGENLCEIKFDTRFVNCLKFQAIEQTGFGCIKSSLVIAEDCINMLPFISKMERPSILEESLILSKARQTSQPQIIFKASVRQLVWNPITLSLKTSTFSRTDRPETIKWGLVPLRPLPPGVENVCDVASHSLINHAGHLVFTCHVTHSLPLLQSMVQIFYHEKKAAVAHLIGPDTLPLPTQVTKPNQYLYLNPVARERAIVIKNSTGDWGFVIGCWKGFKNGIPGIKGTRYQHGKPEEPGSPGTLLVRVWKCSDNRWQTLELPYLRKQYTFSFDGLLVDLRSGSIEISANSTDVVEKLALAFSVSLLHVLCQPRPSSWTPGKSLRPPATRGSRSVNYIPSEDMAFVMAMGYLLATPSNHYIQHTYGMDACAGCGGGGFGMRGNVDCTVADGMGGEWIDIGGDVDGDFGTTDDGGDGGGGDAGDGCTGCGGCGGCGGDTNGDGGGYGTSGGGGVATGGGEGVDNCGGGGVAIVGHGGVDTRGGSGDYSGGGGGVATGGEGMVATGGSGGVTTGGGIDTGGGSGGYNGGWGGVDTGGGGYSGGDHGCGWGGGGCRGGWDGGHYGGGGCFGGGGGGCGGGGGGCGDFD